MLGQLVEYANRKGFSKEPGFKAKRINWLVRVSQDGRFTGVIPVNEDKRGMRFARCPNLEQPEMIGLLKALREDKEKTIQQAAAQLKQASQFLVETCGVVALLPKYDRAGEAKIDDDYKKAADKHHTFKFLVQLASQQVELLKPIYTALSGIEQMEFLRTELKRGKAKPTEKLSFLVGDEKIPDGDSWRDWWRRFYSRYFAITEDDEKASDSKMLSLISGELVRPALTHPKLSELGVGSNTSGASLIGFDKDAFASYGLKKSQNAAIDVEDSFAYRNTLDSLLDDGEKLGQMKVAVWYDQDLPVEDDLLRLLFEPSERLDEAPALERVKRLLSTIKLGDKEPCKRRLGDSQFFSIAMSGASGRVMVRGWQTGSLLDFVDAVNAWFSDLEVVNKFGDANASPTGLKRILDNIQRPQGDKEEYDEYIKPVKMLQIPFWHSALNPKTPIPFAAVVKIMEAHTSSVLNGDFGKALSPPKKAPERSKFTIFHVYSRMSLLKAYHNRKGDHRMTPALDPNHPSKAYHCGRLMCLLARIQEQSSDGDINAGVVQRYYGAASSTHGLVLGRLTRLSQSHLSKISKDSPGLAFWLNSQIAEVWNALGKSLPATLTLEEQSLFALGYYQQFAFNRTKKSGNPEATEDQSENETEASA